MNTITNQETNSKKITLSEAITMPNCKDILPLFQLEEDKLESLSIYHQKDGVHLTVRLLQQYVTCPICKNRTNKVKGYTKKKITHSVLVNSRCFIDYEARRYVCPHCHKTFYEANPFTLPGTRLSAATVYNVLTDLKSPQETFTNVAIKHHISATTVANIFDKHVSISRRVLPEYICLDETYAFKSYQSNYICVLLDFTNQKIIDVLPSRKKHDLINYFTLLPRQEREKVKIVSFDMWETYRIVSKIVFPNCVCAVDRFHVMQELHRKVDRIRINTMKKVKKEVDTLKEKEKQLKKQELTLTPQEQDKLKEASQHYYVLKKFNWMIFKNQGQQFNPNNEKKYNKVLEQYMNFYDLYIYMIHIDPDLDVASYLKDCVSNFYRKCTYDNAQKELEGIIEEMSSSMIPPMQSFSKTLRKWKYEIINSFLIVDEEKQRRISNGLIENRNKAIKTIKHNSNGYLNWKRFRNRILYCLNDDTTFHMYPIQEE